MIQGIGNNGILFTQQGLKNTTVGIKTGCIQNGIFSAEKPGNFFFQLFMQVSCTTDKPHR